jgi:hypothetical protein
MKKPIMWKIIIRWDDETTTEHSDLPGHLEMPIEEWVTELGKESE